MASKKVKKGAKVDNLKQVKTDEIKTKLSVPKDWKMSTEERYVYAYHNSVSPKLQVNQVSLYGIELKQANDKSLTVTVLVKNTVPQSIKLEPANIMLLNSNHELIAKKLFDLSEIGTIPADSSRPWKFTFETEDLKNDFNASEDGWIIAFEIKKSHELDLDETWENSIAEEVKENLQQIVAEATPLNQGEVNFMAISAKFLDSGDLTATLLIRNGSDKDINFEQIPLMFKDASGEVVAQGTFKFENLSVKENTSKPWNFIFPASLITKEKDQIDLAKWQVVPIQES